ncbi:hypothetical protein QTP86_021201 [Hemibagrus guttatus]|nr:hypothetical protein QTP86_021201 [Hemibagrus guttatus]
MPPKGSIYPLSCPEAKTMEEYIQEALEAGYIRPSTFPVATSFFFIEKKDGGLCPCIDYRGLNTLTVRYPYPLLLVPAALEQLREACYFTKLDLCSAYNLNYSIVASPLTSLLRGKPKRLSWTEQARSAFQHLKQKFATAPILCHPDPGVPVVVEVDASSCGIGVVLSQCHGDHWKMHPCAYFSRKLTPAEANYDVGNRGSTGGMTTLPAHCPVCTCPHHFVHASDSGFMRPPAQASLASAGLLEPLLIPQQPWSHITVDFVKDLPSSGGYTTILVAIDRFSKACKLVLLKGLPFAMETSVTLFHKVFRNYGLPEDIVSDRGAEFTS